MASDFKHVRIVEFADTDMAGIVHFSRYFRYVEEAEHAFLRSLGLSVHTAVDGGWIGFPRISVRCDYLRPVRFEEEIETHLRVQRRGTKSLTYHFTISKEGKAVAKGEIVTICCRWSSDGTIETIPIPKEFVERIQEARLPPLDFGSGGDSG